jgi:membrane protein DedA with SNARE-associated domain
LPLPLGGCTTRRGAAYSGGVPEFLRDYPFAAVFAFLFFGAMARGQMLYWLGRGVRVGVLKLRVNLEGGTAWINRCGLFAVPLAYLTVGLQSLILGAAGALHIRWVAFTAATVPGALMWAGIYSTIGWAVWKAVLFDGATSGWLWLVIGGYAVALYGAHRYWRATSAVGAASAHTQPSASPETPA